MRKSTPSNFNLEKKLLSSGYDFVIGIDEAGRGPLAGPVVAAAASPRNLQFVIGNSDADFKKDPNYKLLITNYNDIRDSKTLSEKQREKLYDFIQENFYVGIGICDHKTVDRINILESSFLAMKKAIVDLERSDLLRSFRTREVGPLRKIILIDGNRAIPNFSMEQKAIVNGDKIVKSISAASIIAKVTRDRLMKEMHKKYPEYNFAQHKGYGTKLHFAMLRKHGPCEIHRRSFRPVAKLAKNGN